MREIIFCVILYTSPAVAKEGKFNNEFRKFYERRLFLFYADDRIVLSGPERGSSNYKETYLGKCDLNALALPENADSWKCNKAIDQGKVAKYARCKLVCQEGYDLSKG